MDHGERAQEQHDAHDGLHHLLPAVANDAGFLRRLGFGCARGKRRDGDSLIWDSAMSVEVAVLGLAQVVLFQPFERGDACRAENLE